MGKGASNERCVGGDDEDDPPHLNIEKPHIVTQTKRKRSISNKSTQNSENPMNEV